MKAIDWSCVPSSYNIYALGVFWKRCSAFPFMAMYESTDGQTMLSHLLKQAVDFAVRPSLEVVNESNN